MLSRVTRSTRYRPPDEEPSIYPEERNARLHSKQYSSSSSTDRSAAVVYTPKPDGIEGALTHTNMQRTVRVLGRNLLFRASPTTPLTLKTPYPTPATTGTLKRAAASRRPYPEGATPPHRSPHGPLCLAAFLPVSHRRYLRSRHRRPQLRPSQTATQAALGAATAAEEAAAEEVTTPKVNGAESRTRRGSPGGKDLARPPVTVGGEAPAGEIDPRAARLRAYPGVLTLAVRGVAGGREAAGLRTIRRVS